MKEIKKNRLRFAPSPTGFLHIGSLRTVIFCYLTAKSLDGDFLLRVEDTDQKREVEGAAENIVKVLKFFNIEFDEGPGIGGDYGPYTQSERKEIYQEHVKIVLENDGAYHCFCTPERLEEMRKEQQDKKLPPRYDRKCRDLSLEEVEKRIKAGEKFVIRQKMPLDGEVIVNDGLRGEIKFKAKELEDHVLIKTNGIPTYQFANVVDDHLMKISHVVRAEEWIPSFPKNILLYNIFGWEPPIFYHMPLTLNKEGGKLSKRKNDVSVENYILKGYLPEAIINFCVLLGWRPKGSDAEIFSAEELFKIFKIEDMGTSPAIFDLEKLDYLNGYYIRQKNLDDLVDLTVPYLEKYWEDEDKKEKLIKPFKEYDKNYLKNVIRLEQERMKKLSDVGELTQFFFSEPEYELDLLAWKKITKEQAVENLKKVYELLEKIPEENWTNDSIEEGVLSYLQAKELKIGEYLWPLRACLTGEKASPSPFDVAEVLGKKESLERVAKVIN